jgi:ABC-type sugar transport system permease subunit
MRRDTLSGTIRLESTVDKIKLPEAHEQATPWAALLNTLVAAMFVVAFLVGLGLLVGAFLVHRVLRRIKARLRGEQLPFDQDSSSMDHKRVST